MHLLARLRLMVARHPWTYWLVVAAVATAVALGVARATNRVEAARRSWGDQQAVWVSATAIEPGQPIDADRREVPRAVVPADAVATAPVDAVARQRIGPGEIITGVDVGGRDPANLIPNGWEAFAVPGPAEHFATGDHVRVYSGGELVADGAVIETGETELMVAVPQQAAPAMAAALLADAVTISLTPDP